MKNSRIIVTHYGGSDAIQLVEEECPQPKKGEALVKVITAGVSMPDVMAREGVHPETPLVPFTPGWDFVGRIESLNDGNSTSQAGQLVAALPIHGSYTQFICIPETELIPVPAGVDAGEAVSLVLNYITAYQMMHRSAKVKAGQRVLIHGASGGVGTALLQLGQLAGLEMYGTCSPSGAQAVIELGATPIDYKSHDLVEEIYRLTGDGVDVVFDPIGGSHLWHSRKALRKRGKVIGYGLISSIRGSGLSAKPRKRRRYGGTATFAWYIIASRLLPGRKRLIPYSIQTLKRLKPEYFRDDLMILFDLLKQKKIKPVIAKRFPLSQAKQAQELLEKGGVIGKIVLECNGSQVSDQ